MYGFLPDTGVGALPKFIVRPKKNQNKMVESDFFIINDNVIGD